MPLRSRPGGRTSRRIRHLGACSAAPPARILRRAPGASDKPQTDGFGPLLTLRYVDGDALPFRQAHDAGTLERRGVHEDILSTLIRSDKAEALIGVVPFHRAQLFDGRAVA